MLGVKCSQVHLHSAQANCTGVGLGATKVREDPHDVRFSTGFRLAPDPLTARQLDALDLRVVPTKQQLQVAQWPRGGMVTDGEVPRSQTSWDSDPPKAAVHEDQAWSAFFVVLGASPHSHACPAPQTWDDLSESNRCCVCLQSLSWSRESTLVKCGHRFHRTCISTWLVGKKTCPYCRAKCDQASCKTVAPDPIYSQLGNLLESAITRNSQLPIERRLVYAPLVPAHPIHLTTFFSFFIYRVGFRCLLP